MGNACSGCCSWVFAGGRATDAGRGKSDEANTWFEHDSVPLVSARYDNDAIGSDGVVTKTVVMRSPRAAAAAVAARTSHSPSKSASPRQAATASATSKSRLSTSTNNSNTQNSSSSSSDSSRLVKAPSRGLVCVDKSSDDDESDSVSRRHQHPGKRHDSLHTASQRSHSAVSSASSSSTVSSKSSNSNHVVGQHDAAHQHDDATPRRHSSRRESEADESEQSSSHAGDAAASKAPGSPKKPRYGRKNYRANSGRKKSA